jgi:D-alanyl-D-alanine carboxypeptidase
MTLDCPVHWASAAKMLTAALLLRALDEGRLPSEGVETPLSSIDNLLTDELHRLHCRRNPPEAGAITLRHLLQHRAGILDAMVDDANSPATGPAELSQCSLLGRILSGEPRWQGHWCPWDAGKATDPRAGTLNFYFANQLGKAARSAPGAGFHYSDTGYVVLGLVVETLFGRPLHALLREYLFEPAGAGGAFLAYHDPTAVGEVAGTTAEIWLGDTPALASGLDLSFDWGGGGVVSTVSEMNAILRWLLEGDLLSAETARLMWDWAVPDGLAEPRLGVGCGMFKTCCLEGELWGHSGAWGARMYYHPELRIYFSGTVNQALGAGNWHWPFIEQTRQHFVNAGGAQSQGVSP